MNRIEPQPWIGLFEVKALEGNEALEPAAQAFVNVLALCTTHSGYLRVAGAALRRYRFEVVAVADVTPFGVWTQQHNPNQNIRELATLLSAANPVQFDEFQAFPPTD
jgi:hypothetical protein